MSMLTPETDSVMPGKKKLARQRASISSVFHNSSTLLKRIGLPSASFIAGISYKPIISQTGCKAHPTSLARPSPLGKIIVSQE